MNSEYLTWFKSSYSGGSGDDCVEVALDWRKSSYSSSGSGDCVEVALDWHKSTHSSGGDGDCVEVAPTPHRVHIRDSKFPGRGCLVVSPAGWSAFLNSAALQAR